jgi:hypothetical protein
LVFTREKILRVIVRHCTFSDASSEKQRPQGFDRADLFLTLVRTLSNYPRFTLTVFLDKQENESTHFVEEIINQSHMPIEIVKKNCGSEAASFLAMLEYVRDSGWDPQDIVVFLEDDYAVSPIWPFLLEEGLEISDYVSLYDHPDKYSNMYKSIRCLLYKQPKRHWRTTPSTTNSYAMKKQTLMRDLDIHMHFSTGVRVSRDHEKFLELWNVGRKLITCIPAAWSHEEVDMQCDLKISQ